MPGRRKIGQAPEIKGKLARILMTFRRFAETQEDNRQRSVLNRTPPPGRSPANRGDHGGGSANSSAEDLSFGGEIGRRLASLSLRQAIGNHLA